MGGVGGSREGGGTAFLIFTPEGIGGSREGGEVSPTASPIAAVGAVSESVGFLLITSTLVGVDESRAGQTQASGNESWKGWLSEEAVTTSSVVSGGEGGVSEGGLNVKIVARASLCVPICRDGRAVCGRGPPIPATLGLHH